MAIVGVNVYNNEIKIHSCPFCGKDPMIKLSNDDPSYYKIYHACKKEEGQIANIIINTKWCKTMIEAINIWNERI